MSTHEQPAWKETVSTKIRRTCDTCGHTGTYTSEARAQHHFPTHSCTTNLERQARAQRKADLLASEGERRDCECPRAQHEHGTRVAYVVDKCRCHECKVATRLYEQQRRRARAYGRKDLVDAQPVRDHLRSLSEQGMGWKRVAKAAGVGESTVYPILYGKHLKKPDHPEHRPPRKQIRPNIAQKLLAVELDVAPGALVPGDGARLRLHSLVALGWSMSKLATELGMLPSNFGTLIHGSTPIRQQTAAQVLALYDRLWDQSPPRAGHRDKIAYSRATSYANQHGWHPPLYWDHTRRRRAAA